MKRLLPLLVLVPLASCATLGKLLEVPGAAVSDVTGAIPGEPAEAAVIGEAAGDAAGIITGNPLVDLLVTTVVGGAAGYFLRKKKTAA